MKAGIERSEFFRTDFALQYGWYLEEAGERVAERYMAAVEDALRRLTVNPKLGRLRKFRAPALRAIRNLRVAPPFGVHLIFYRHVDDTVIVERVMHGARDLPRRLLEPPGSA